MIHAQEVIYSRVEAPYSRTHKSGYQVVHQSPGLPPAEVREVESQVRCFFGKNIDVRYQYFHLGSGHVAVAACRALAEIDPQIIDRAGRSGPFIAHALVVSPDEFAAMGANPFWLIDYANPFVLDVAEMIDTQRARPAQRVVEVEVSDAESRIDYTGFDIAGWKLRDFTALWLAAADARGIVARGQVIGLQSGDEEQVVELLRLLFAHLPPAVRHALTFNTFVDNCQPLPGVYWATGGHRRNPLPNAIHVRLDRPTMEHLTLRPDHEIEALAQQVFGRLRAAQGLADEG